METSTKALVCLLNAQPNLAHAVPVLGHIPKFFRQLTVQPKIALEVLHQLSLSEVFFLILFYYINKIINKNFYLIFKDMRSCNFTN